MTCTVLPRPMSSARRPAQPESHIADSQARPRCWYGRSVAVSPGGGSTGSGADPRLAILAARSARGPLGRDLDGLAVDLRFRPARIAPSASVVRIRVRGGRRRRSSRAGSRITQRPRSLIHRALRLGQGGDLPGVEQRPVECELPAEFEQRFESEPGFGQLAGSRSDHGAQPGAEQAGRPRSPRCRRLPGPRPAGPSRLVSASSSRSIVEGLGCSSTCAIGGHTEAPRRSASSRSVSACGPNLVSTVSG